MAARFLKIAAIYLQIGVVMGLAMGFTHHFEYAPVHAHLNLLGWATLALAGVIYHLYPDAATTRLAVAHFWLHNVGLPAFTLGLFALRAGVEAAERLVALGAAITLAGIVAFVINVVRNVGPAPKAKPQLAPTLPSLHISEWK